MLLSGMKVYPENTGMIKKWSHPEASY